MFWMFDIRWICATVYVLVFHVGPGSITSPTALAFATIRLGIYAVRRLGELASISNVGTFDKISIICRGLGQTDFLLWSQLREYSVIRPTVQRKAPRSPWKGSSLATVVWVFRIQWRGWRWLAAGLGRSHPLIGKVCRIDHVRIPTP